jgi:hypothetical protein
MKALIVNGEIPPLEPLPADWGEGQRLCVEKADDGADVPVEEIDRDFAALAALCGDSEPADEEALKSRARRSAT